MLAEFRKRLPEMVTRAPDMPRLLHAWLTQQVEGQHSLQMRSQDLRDLTQMIRGAQRRTISAILGTGLLIVAAVLYGLEAGGPRILGVPACVWIAALGGAWALLAAWPRQEVMRHRWARRLRRSPSCSSTTPSPSSTSPPG